jgi:hypothetical protein
LTTIPAKATTQAKCQVITPRRQRVTVTEMLHLGGEFIDGGPHGGLVDGATEAQ